MHNNADKSVYYKKDFKEHFNIDVMLDYSRKYFKIFSVWYQKRSKNRIDYVSINTECLNKYKGKKNPWNALKREQDERPLVVRIRIGIYKTKRTGYWKLNVSYLENKIYKKKKKGMEDIKHRNQSCPGK